MIFISRDESVRELLREQLKSDDGISLSHKLSSRYSLLVEHTDDYGMVVKPTRMDRVAVFEFLNYFKLTVLLLYDLSKCTNIFIVLIPIGKKECLI